MVEATVVLGVIVATLITIVAAIKIRRWLTPVPSRPLPPGPCQLPLLGNLLQVNAERVHLTYFDWAKEYGKIFICKLLKVQAVVLNRQELVRKAYGSDEYSDVFCDRPPTFMGRYVAYNYMDIIFARYSRESVEMRKVAAQGFLKYGDGTDLFQPTVQAEIRRVLENVGNKNGGDFDPRNMLERSVGDLMSYMLVGTGISEDLYKHVSLFQYWVNTLVSPSNELMLYNFPWLRKVPGKFGNMYKIVQENKDKLQEFFFTKQKQTYSVYTERGLIDMLLNAQTQHTWLTDDHIQGMIIDVIGAASITLANATLSALLMLLNHPDCQERMFKDIEAHVGLSRLPVLADMEELPYCEAVIYEALRLATHVPIVFPHRATKDIEFEDYLIPKDTWIFANLWKIHHDEEVFEDPWKFKPERLLDENGKLLSPSHPVRQTILPWSHGIRKCLGENTVKARMFLYLSALVQNFKFLPPQEGALPEADPHNYLPGIILKPMLYKCRAVIRK